MATNWTSFEKEAYRRRIQLIRRLFGDNQKQFAERIGLPYKRWHHYEQGYPIPKDTAWLLRRLVPGLSTDWIWFGDTRGVQGTLLRRLEKLERDEQALGRALAKKKQQRERDLRDRLSKPIIRKSKGAG